MDYNVVIVGAGPYGLGAGAHLRQIQGLGVKVFGQPMSFWKNQMPVGMLLRSSWEASNLGTRSGNSRSVAIKRRVETVLLRQFPSKAS